MSDDTQGDTLRFLYTFRFPDRTEKRFAITLNAATLELMSDREFAKPDWTKLKYFQCEHCPLGDDVEYCPVAVNLASLVESFKDSVSFEQAFVTVQTAGRTYEKQTTLQKGVSSIIGIAMVTSNCPVMDKLRPNVQFHLPFASGPETIYRAISMYLISQYFVMRRGGKPDWELSNLAEIYHAVSYVNQGISRRLSHASIQDANVNAVIILSTFGLSLGDYLEDSLQDLEALSPGSAKPEGG
ncbi:MAG: DUF6901 family protein [Nitrospiraceae bacterium]